jgi:hypothetical protein
MYIGNTENDLFTYTPYTIAPICSVAPDLRIEVEQIGTNPPRYRPQRHMHALYGEGVIDEKGTRGRVLRRGEGWFYFYNEKRLTLTFETIDEAIAFLLAPRLRLA